MNCYPRPSWRRKRRQAPKAIIVELLLGICFAPAAVFQVSYDICSPASSPIPRLGSIRIRIRINLDHCSTVHTTRSRCRTASCLHLRDRNLFRWRSYSCILHHSLYDRLKSRTSWVHEAAFWLTVPTTVLSKSRLGCAVNWAYLLHLRRGRQGHLLSRLARVLRVLVIC
jgi:hypothetical protein